MVTLIPIDEYKEKYQKLDETPLAGHKEEDEACFGIAYRIASGDADNVLAHLDHREKDGFITFCMPVYSCKTDERFADATVYVGTSQNTSFKGPAPFQEMAVQIAKSRGDSGWNRDYLFGLETALSVLGYQGDLHVGELAKRVREISSVGVDEELTDEIVGSRCINSEDIAELEKLRADVH